MIRKRFISLLLVFAMCITSTTLSYASNDSALAKGYASTFHVTQQTVNGKVQEYSVPAEVMEYINEVLQKNPNAEIVVSAPYDTPSTRAGEGSWSSTRTYGGHTLRDWNVHVTNAFNMTPIKTGRLAGEFASDVLVYGSGVLLDSFIPFGSVGITLIQFVQKIEWAVYAEAGDKASAAPKYTSDTKFTYVQVGGQELLGLRSHKAKLERITWYFYSDKLHDDASKISTYNKTWTTPSYNNPDPKAITGYGIGGIIEESVKVRIGDKDFILE